ncbi:hypothetical protein BGZ99_002889 [Dissophora globulifera]|uniref:Uncharacterized protein n=1 Tax=Dissophora globulifera TaxID=979702 RepID=A0A9P6UVW7_9FUNG|nr:hypothetical protein BGZ99_002889 [Dissophora globulifera]
MAFALRSINMGLPRIPMSRIPLVAFANTQVHAAPANTNKHLNYSHSDRTSAYSSSSSSWNKAVDHREHSSNNIDKSTKEYLREVKQFENAEDELMMELGLAMNSVSHHLDNISGQKKRNAMDRAASAEAAKHVAHSNNSSGGKVTQPRRGNGSSVLSSTTTTTFEETLEEQVRADVIHPGTKRNRHLTEDHHREMVSSLMDELKGDQEPTNLSQHASDAIRMVESHSMLKQDKAPVHAVRDEDPDAKHTRSHKRK